MPITLSHASSRYFPVLNSCMGYPIPNTAADSLDVESSYPSVELRDWLKRKWERISFSHYYWITLNGNYLHKEVQHLSSLFCLQPWLNRKYLLLKNRYKYLNQYDFWNVIIVVCNHWFFITSEKLYREIIIHKTKYNVGIHKVSGYSELPLLPAKCYV